jgi:hypothetical protein
MIFWGLIRKSNIKRTNNEYMIGMIIEGRISDGQKAAWTPLNISPDYIE